MGESPTPVLPIALRRRSRYFFFFFFFFFYFLVGLAGSVPIHSHDLSNQTASVSASASNSAGTDE
jgi:hypothetical protein